MQATEFVPDDATLTKLLEEVRTIAVVGISENPTRDSHTVSQYMQKHGYRIVPINPTLDSVLGEKAYPSVQAAVADGQEIDLVDVFRRPDAVPGVVDDAIAAHATRIWFQLGVVNEEATRKAADAGLQVVLDRCLRVEHRRLVS